MPSRKKIDLAKVLACMNTVCPKCQAVIEPAQMGRVDFEHMQCPFCDAVFKPEKRGAA